MQRADVHPDDAVRLSSECLECAGAAFLGLYGEQAAINLMALFHGGDVGLVESLAGQGTQLVELALKLGVQLRIELDACVAGNRLELGADKLVVMGLGDA